MILGLNSQILQFQREAPDEATEAKSIVRRRNCYCRSCGNSIEARDEQFEDLRRLDPIVRVDRLGLLTEASIATMQRGLCQEA